MSRLLRSASWLFLLAAIGCDDDATQVVVVVSSDLRVPDEIDRVVIEGTLPDGRTFDATAELHGANGEELPRVLTLVRRAGPPGPIALRVVGRHGRVVVVERTAQVAFLPGRTRMLPVELLRMCQGVTCPPGETCGDGGCRREEVQAIELLPWPGHEGLEPREPSCEGAGCGPTCREGFFDCDGRPENGCESNLRDLEACGECGRRCVLPNAIVSCASGACMPIACVEGFADCDGRPENGCESNLRELDHCGACDARCEAENAEASCATGECRVEECGEHYGDCDGRAENGCETDLRSTWEHCSACGRPCPTDVPNTRTGCEDGRCVLRCTPGWADCDGVASNGCEAYLGSPETCGSCGQTCGGFLPLCAGSPEDGYRCTFYCSGERCDDQCVDVAADPNHCGDCDQRCSAPPGRMPACEEGRCTHL